MNLLSRISAQSESCRFYCKFLDLSCEAGPSATLFSQQAFLTEFLFSLEVDDLIMRSGTCLVKLGLRPSFLF